MARIYADSTEYVANEITDLRGSPGDIISVGVYHTTGTETPGVEDFTAATLVDGVADPDAPLAEAGVVDVLSLIGPRDGIALAPGVYRRWVLVTTAAEDIIRRGGTVEIL